MKRMEKSLSARWVLIIGAGVVAATLLGFLGRFFWVFDLFSHFRVQVFQACLLLIGIAIWKRNNRQILLWVVLACVNYAVVLPFYFGRPPAAVGNTSRAMLINLDASNGNTEEVLTSIQAVDPDLLLLEEVTSHWAEELRVLDYPYRLAKVREDCFGIMLLSKFPLSHSQVVYVGSAGVPTLTTDVHLPTGDIFLVGTHPVPPISTEYSRDRNSQLQALPKLVSEQKKPVLLIGDLNTSPWSSHFSQLLSDSKLKNSMVSFGVQPSWPAQLGLLRIPIDHVLHDPRILIHQRMMGPNVGSDHLPVIVDFSIPTR
jgi:endonuclease/exonuclease/phosphatase (EEP) superfamily protein YafD